MNVKEAVSQAKSYITDVFSDDHIDDVGLEEVEFDEESGVWSVTIGFSRPWDTKNPTQRLHAMFNSRTRSYKIVQISNENGIVLSVKNRMPA